MSVKTTLSYLRQRLDERSTYMLIVGSLGAVAGLPVPFNWIGGVALLVAAFVPDGSVKPGA